MSQEVYFSEVDTRKLELLQETIEQLAETIEKLQKAIEFNNRISYILCGKEINAAIEKIKKEKEKEEEVKPNKKELIRVKGKAISLPVESCIVNNVPCVYYRTKNNFSICLRDFINLTINLDKGGKSYPVPSTICKGMQWEPSE